jgi:uncharacterized protein (TIGR02246 family)
MKNLIVMIIALMGTTFTLQAQQDNTQAAWTTMEAAKDAYGKLDVDAFLKVFTTDAVMVSPMGDWVVGKQAIREVHTQIFESISKMGGYTSKEIKTGMQDEQIRMLSDEVAQYTCNSIESAEGQEKKMAFTALISKQTNGEWLVTSVQMTPFVPYANRQQ